MVFNGLMFLVDIGVILANRRWPQTGQRFKGVFLLSLVGFAGAAFALGLWLAEDMFHFAALMASAIFLHTVGVLGGLAVVFGSQNRRLANLFNGLAFAILLVGVYAFAIEPQRLQVTRYEITSAKVTAPVKIVVLADIQTDRVGDYERQALAAAMAENPDLILLPGDYVQLGDPALYRQEADQLNLLFHAVGLAAPLGVYAVTGNVDPPGESARIFAGLDVVYFQQAGQAVSGELVVTGLPLYESSLVDYRVAPEASFHIVLGHMPNFALGDVQADLLVAGHTHGGQVQIPFFGPPITLSAVPRAWAAGALTEIRPDTWLVVSKGIGMERHNAPRLRFLAPPEIVVITVNPK